MSGGVWGAIPGLTEPLSKSETRVLRYLPTNLSVREIADGLSVSVHTVRTHMRHLYAKLGAHRRTEVVERAPFPTEQGIALAKDAWMTGIGLGLVIDDLTDRVGPKD